MNWLDILIIAILIAAAWSGMRRGLVRELCRTGATLLALFTAYRNAALWSGALATRFMLSPDIAQGIIFGTLLFGIATFGYALEPLAIRLAGRTTTGVSVNRWGGSIAGLIKGGALVILITVAASRSPWPATHKALDDSVFAVHILQAAPSIYNQVNTLVSPEETVF